jgi:hypothetical protein
MRAAHLHRHNRPAHLHVFWLTASLALCLQNCGQRHPQGGRPGVRQQRHQPMPVRRAPLPGPVQLGDYPEHRTCLCAGGDPQPHRHFRWSRPAAELRRRRAGLQHGRRAQPRRRGVRIWLRRGQRCKRLRVVGQEFVGRHLGGGRLLPCAQRLRRRGRLGHVQPDASGAGAHPRIQLFGAVAW